MTQHTAPQPDAQLLADLLAACRTRGWMIATAESCTGGLLGAALTDLPGASAIFERGYITYTNTAKQHDLGVPAETLERFGAVSEETARAMATGARRAADADLAVAITGIAGPGGSDHKPEGRVCFALATRAGPTVSETVDFGPLGRAAVRAAARDHALRMLARAAQTA